MENSHEKNRGFNPGNAFEQTPTIEIDGEIIKVLRVEKAEDFLVGSKLLEVLTIDPVVLRSIPILFVDKYFSSGRGGYSAEFDVILMPTNSKDNPEREKHVIEHEIVHALLVKFVNRHQITEFEKIYEHVKSIMTEEDVTFAGLTSFNFNKNIHEFIADAVTLPNMINALKEKGLYDQVIEHIQAFIDQARDEFLGKL